MVNQLINAVVLRRIDDAANKGDIKLLEEHLKDNYDIEIHKAVYDALYRIGKNSIYSKVNEPLLSMMFLYSGKK